MATEIDRPIFTRLYSPACVPIVSGSLYIAGTTEEERSQFTSWLENKGTNVTFARFSSGDDSGVIFDLEGRDVEVKLRSFRSVSEFLSVDSYSAIYLDITGLEHRIWAPLLRGLREGEGQRYCVYVEPAEYRFSTAPRPSSLFDLSQGTRGIAPLPSFASLSSDEDDDVRLVPILGFEGPRFLKVIDSVQPRPGNIWPIIGVPGYRAEYPFFSYLENTEPLSDSESWRNARLARANCPFSLYGVLLRMPGAEKMKIALLGTKPHALGAILYYLEYPRNTEIVYDHPRRTGEWTDGISHICLYDLTLFWDR